MTVARFWRENESRYNLIGTKCGNCESVCPEEAIREGESAYVIDPDKCVDCGVCADECPVEAISSGA